MKQALVFLFIMFPFFSFAQEPQEEPQEEVFQVVEKMPQFPGGQEALVKFLQTNIKYPEEDRKNGKEGKVYLQFIIEKDGSVTEVKPIGKVEEWATKAMVDEAMRLINVMPNFEPGTQRGKPVRCKYTLPIVFKLG
ncbi:MAG: energy transducer TonB [Bacteroidia bacterium]